MLKRKIHHVFTKELADESIYERVASGKEYLGGIIVTDREIIFNKGIRKVFLPYEEIVWAYRQIEESHMSLGCCGGVLEEFRVIMFCKNGEKAVVSSDRESIAIAIIDYISQICSDVVIGYTDENKAKFELN